MNTNINGFPSHFADPKEKASVKYGTAWAKAILGLWGINFVATNGLNAWGLRRARFLELQELAKGSSDTNRLTNVLGVSITSNNSLSGQPGVDVSALNYAAKFVNSTVQRIVNRGYIAQTNVIDPTAIDEKETTLKKMEYLYQLKQMQEELQGFNVEELFPGMDTGFLSKDIEDALADAEMEFSRRLTSESDSMLLFLTQVVNDLQEIRRLYVYDTIVFGICAVQVCIDHNGYPRLRRINPCNLIFSASENETFNDLNYAGEAVMLTVTDFLKETEPFMTPQEQQEIVNKYQTTSFSAFPNFAFGANIVNRPTDAQGYIPVFRFEFITQDTSVYEVKTNKQGNKKIYQKPYNYEKNPEYFAKHPNREVIKTRVNQVYSGTYVIGSDTVYGYGVKPSMPHQVTDKKLSYVVFAPNNTYGSFCSMLEQMKEPLFMLNVAYNKVKQIIATNINAMLEIDVSQLENVGIASDTGTLSPNDILKMAFQQRVLLVRKVNTDGGDISINNYPALRDTKIGITLAEQIQVMQVCLDQIREITGLNSAVDSSNPIPGQLKSVTQASVSAADTALGYLYNADFNMFKSICERLLETAQLSILVNNVKFEGWVQDALGDGTKKFFKSNDKMPFKQYGMIIEPEPSQFQWESLYQSMAKSMAEGMLMPSDLIYIQGIRNLKEAENEFLRRERKRRKEKMQEAQIASEQNAKIQQESAMLSHQNLMEQMQADLQIKMQLETHKHTLKMEEIKAEGEYSMMNAAIQADAKVVSNKTLADASLAGKALVAERQKEIEEIKMEIVEEEKDGAEDKDS